MKFFKLQSDLRKLDNQNQILQTKEEPKPDFQFKQRNSFSYVFDFEEYQNADDYQRHKAGGYFVRLPDKKAYEFIFAYQNFKYKLSSEVCESVKVWKANYILIKLSTLIKPEEDIVEIMQCFNDNFDEITQIFGTNNLTFEFQPFYP